MFQLSKGDGLTVAALVLLLLFWEAGRPVGRVASPAPAGPVLKPHPEKVCSSASAENVNRALAAENAELRRRLAEVQYAEQRCLREVSSVAAPASTTTPSSPTAPGEAMPNATTNQTRSSEQSASNTHPPTLLSATNPSATNQTRSTEQSASNTHAPTLPLRRLPATPPEDDEGFLLEPPSCGLNRRVEFIPRSESGKYPAPVFMPQSPTGDHRQEELPNATCVGEILDWLGRSDHKHLESIGWSHGDLILGAVIVTNGRGDVWVQRNNRAEFRGVDRVATIAKYARQLDQVTIFLLTINDIDVWSFIHPSRAEALRDLFRRCPLFYLHWNPAMDVNTGRLPQRTILIPDPYPLNWELEPPKFPKAADRRGNIVWRGATLGQYPPGNYAASDRYKALKALNEVPFADCAITDYCNGVDKSQAPWPGKRLSVPDQVSYGAVLDVDGNAGTWSGMRWKMGHGCAVFKARSSLGWVQWYYPLLEHKVHLWVFDPNKGDASIRGEAQRLLNDKGQDGRLVTEQLGQAAYEFAKRHFNEAAVERVIREAIVGAWSNATWREQMDWRIRGTSSL